MSEEDVKYEHGWAPCAHSDEERAELAANGYLYPGVDVETLLFELNWLGATPEVLVDQWWGVSAKGHIYANYPDGEVTYATFIQGDSLLLAATETVKRWIAKRTEVTGKAWEPQSIIMERALRAARDEPLFEGPPRLFGGPPRPVRRIETFLAATEIAWGRAPDQRFGQLVYNALLRERNDDGLEHNADWLFNVEDDVALERMRQYARLLA
jgi:hypothetical protein